MVLLLQGFDQRPYSLTLTFLDKEESFIHYERIFRTFASIEQDYRFFILRHEDEYVRKRLARRQPPGSLVHYISKNSPLEIGAFIAEHWFELLLFVVGVRGDLIGTIRGNYNSFEDFVDLLEAQVRTLTDDFPEYELENLREIWIWFMAMGQDQQIRFMKRVKYFSNALRDLQKITYRKNP